MLLTALLAGTLLLVSVCGAPVTSANKPVTRGSDTRTGLYDNDLVDTEAQKELGAACWAHETKLIVHEGDTDEVKYGIAKCIIAVRGSCGGLHMSRDETEIALKECMPSNDELRSTRLNLRRDHPVLHDFAIDAEDDARVKVLIARAITTLYEATHTPNITAPQQTRIIATAVHTMEEELKNSGLAPHHLALLGKTEDDIRADVQAAIAAAILEKEVAKLRAIHSQDEDFFHKQAQLVMDKDKEIADLKKQLEERDSKIKGLGPVAAGSLCPAGQHCVDTDKFERMQQDLIAC